MSHRPLRVAVWAAVSSKRQAEDEKMSLPEQERLGRECAARLDAEVVRVYRIPGHTRDIVFWSDAERSMEAYRQLREDAAAGAIDLLWAYDVDRLGRDPALAQQVISLVEKSPAPTLARAEVYLETSPHQVGQKTVGHRYVSAIQGVRAGEEIEKLRYRHDLGMRGRARRGIHAGHWPTGYSPLFDERGKCVGAEFDGQVGIPRLATALFLRGESYRQIARALDASPFDPPRSGGPWIWQTVRAMMANDTYAGLVTWGDEGNEDPSARFPALWDAETYRAVVRERRRRREALPNRRGGPLRGVAICRRCGKGLCRNKNQYHVYLSCRTGGRRGCHRNYIREDKALEAVAEFLESLLTDEVMDAALGELAPDAALGAEMDALDARAADLEGRRRRLAEAYAAGVMDLEVYGATDDDVKRQLAAAQLRRRQVQAELDAIPDLQDRRAILQELVGDVAALLAGPPGHVAAQLRHAGIRVVAEAGQFVVGLVE
jgi:DNA invertase Pin-like site-specific DNA recombinase